MTMALATALARRSLAFGQQMAQAVGEGSMNSLVLVTRFGDFDEAAGEYKNGTPTVIYQDADFPGIGGIAGVTPTSGPVNLAYGDEPEYMDSIDVYLPKRAPVLPRIDDEVLVTAGPDPQFVNRQYRVISVIGSGRLVPSIHLRCMGTAPSKQSA